MKTLLIPSNLAFGLKDPLPAKGFPDGKIRWRIRSDNLVLARVRTIDGIREFVVQEVDGYWMPLAEKGRNADA
jgi:hypothetical protein